MATAVQQPALSRPERGSGVLGAAVSRPCRVLCLIGVIAILSLLDLHHTLLYLQTIGMSEANPLARFVIEADSPALLIAFKLATLVISASILFALRHRGSAELGAWACAGVLVWLTARWDAYTDEILTLGPALVEAAQFDPARWTSMTR